MGDFMAGGAGAVLSGGFEDAFSEFDEGGRYSYLPRVDLICAGVPCQDVSVAGKRAGLKGERTGLFFEFARLLKELRPTWFLFENVPGLLSSNRGRDFAEVQRVLMVECGYGISWRVLDSQFFGVAQRRQRLFVVGYFGAPCPAEVLFEPTGGAGDSTAGGETWSDVAAPLTSGIGVTGNPPGRRREDDINLAICLESGQANAGLAYDQCTNLTCLHEAPIVAHSLSASAGHHGHSSPRGDGSDNLVVYTNRGGEGIETNPTLTARSCHNGPMQNDIAAIVIQDVRAVRDKKRNGIGISEGGPSYTLDRTSQHGVAFTLPSVHRGVGNGHNTNYVAGPLGGSSRSGGFSPNAEQAADGQLICSQVDPDGMRDFTGLPEGMDSARYRALGNAVTTKVARWIGSRIVAAEGRGCITNEAEADSTP